MISLGFLSCDSDDYPHTEVPSVILNKFWIHFPNATDVEFTKSGEIFEVEFEYEDDERTYYFNEGLGGTGGQHWYYIRFKNL